jgi:hypothetical protein
MAQAAAGRRARVDSTSGGGRKAAVTMVGTKAQRFASSAVVGALAGLMGTAVMTVTSTVEARLRGREPSAAPAEAAGKLLGVEPVDEAGRARFSRIVHYGYGTAWGAAHGMLAAAGLPPLAVWAVHFGLVWGGELVMLPALSVAPPAREWGAVELAVDAGHHLAYTAATSAAYRALNRSG